MKQNQNDMIVVLDFGAQYSQLIARRVREHHVYSQILPFGSSIEEIEKLHPRGIIFSGGPASVGDAGSPRPDAGVYALGIPILGICYGLQAMTIQNGGKVNCPEKKEYGFAKLHITASSQLFEGVEEGSQIWMSHGDSVSCRHRGSRSVPVPLIADIQQYRIKSASSMESSSILKSSIR